MMTREWSARIVFVAVLVLQVLAAVAHAGGRAPRAQTTSSTGGGVTGTITDATGAVLSGVTVTISGTALMGTRTVTSSSEGLYRFPAVPPGDYSLLFSRQGFTTTTRNGIHVGSGFTATVDVMLSVEGVQADLTVVSGSTIIDQQSTAISTHFTAQQLSDLPTSRSVFGILSATPAVHVARFEVGGGSGEASLYSAYGTPRANSPMIEGINLSGIFSTGTDAEFRFIRGDCRRHRRTRTQWPLRACRCRSS